MKSKVGFSHSESYYFSLHHRHARHVQATPSSSVLNLSLTISAAAPLRMQTLTMIQMTILLSQLISTPSPMKLTLIWRAAWEERLVAQKVLRR
jgi:hypothetical protein